MSEWKEYRFTEAATLTNGRAYLQPELQDAGKYKIVRVGNLSGGDNWFYSDMELPEDKYCHKGDLLYAWACSFGPYIWNEDKTIYHYHIWKVDVNKALTDKYYLYYYLKYYTPKWMGLTNGSVMMHITKGSLEKQMIRLPDLDTQRNIASILSSLDDKIAVNKKICENLEAQAQALFKHWFVDFAPFKNGRFVESELGLIPEGWRVGTYDEIIQDTISGDWGKEKPEGNYTHKVACIRGCDFQDVKMGLRGKTPERYILEKNYNSKRFNDKDVLVEISGGTATVSTGRICPVSQLLINKYNGDIVCTNFCRLVRPRLGYSSYLYYSWKYKYDRKVMFGYENGTSGIKNFSIKDFTTREPLIIPKLSDLHIFEDMVEHIHTHIQNLGSESAKLAIIRDTLLPKLMSGQIEI